MTDELAHTVERLRQQNAARVGARRVRAAVSPARPTLAGASFENGARVFDRVSGLEGEVAGTKNLTVSSDTTQR